MRHLLVLCMLCWTVFAHATNDFLSDRSIISGQVLQGQCQTDGALGLSVAHTASTAGVIDMRIAMQGERVRANSLQLEIVVPRGLSYKPGDVTVVMDDKTTIVPPDYAHQTLRIPLEAKSINWQGSVAELRLQMDSDVYYTDLTLAARLIYNSNQEFNAATPYANHKMEIRNRRVVLSNEVTRIEKNIQGYGDNGDDFLLEQARVGVANVRLLMEDGTYVVTDDEGKYHIEGITPGTHVLQVDPTSLPEGLDIVACEQNTRVAGSGNSRFIDINPGGLWHEDFYVAPRAVENGRVSVVSSLKPLTSRIYSVRIEANIVQTEALEGIYDLTLPYGYGYVTGSAYLDNQLMRDPERLGDHRIRFHGLDLGKRKSRRMRFQISKNIRNKAGVSVLEGRYSFYHRGQLESVQNINHILESCDQNQCDTSTDTQKRSVVLPALSRKNTHRYTPDNVPVAKNIADFDTAWLATQTPSVKWLMPAEKSITAAPVTSLAIQHPPKHKIHITVNGKALNPLYFINTKWNRKKTVGRSFWQGIPLEEGVNTIVAVVRDARGKRVENYRKQIVYTREARRIEFEPSYSRLVADGQTPVKLVFDVQNFERLSIAKGVAGRFTITPPYLPIQQIEIMSDTPTNRHDTYGQFVVGKDGRATIELAPTLHTGPATVTVWIKDQPFDIPVWIEAPRQDWVMVGLGEIGGGFNSVSGSNIGLLEENAQNDVYVDGKLAFYAKGTVKGEWLITAAFDSEKERDTHPLFQLIDPDDYFTLYQDASQQHYDAASQQPFYLRVSKQQFQAVYGDIETGLTNTELGRYQRRINGLSLKQGGEDTWVNYDVFISDDNSQFVRDEIQGNGTSGIYFFNQQNIRVNSETITIEVRDRHHSDRIIQRDVLRRFLDYRIDYAQGSIYFKQPVTSRDSRFNPQFIVADYEIESATNNTTQGGHAEIDLIEDTLIVGGTLIRENQGTSTNNLAAANGTWHIGENTRADVELGSSNTPTQSGDAYIAKLSHEAEDWRVQLNSRQQHNGYGLGHQNDSEQGTERHGVVGEYRFDDTWSIHAEQYQQDNLDTNNRREVSEVAVNYDHNDYAIRMGRIRARDAIGTTISRSNLYLFDIEKQLDNQDITTYLRTQTDVNGAQNTDFPERYLIGVDMKVNEAFSVYSQAELTKIDERDTAELRVGARVKPWKNAVLDTSTGSRNDEYGPRLFSNLGLLQRIPINDQWSWDFGVDGSYTNRDVANPFDPDVTPTSGTNGLGSFLAFSSGVSYRAHTWSINSRYENRFVRDTAGRARGVYLSFHKKHSDDFSYSAYANTYQSDNRNAISDVNMGVSFAYRPLQAHWQWLNEFEIIEDQFEDATNTERFVNKVLNNGRLRWRINEQHHTSLLYGTRVVSGTNVPAQEVFGFSQLLGAEYRYDISPKWDVGLQSSIELRVDENQTVTSFGPALGWTPIKNVWLRAGFNVEGYTQQDLATQLAQSSGVWFKLSFKFDQDTIKSAF